MADAEDTKALEERVYELASGGNLLELTVLLGEHPEVDVDECESSTGWSSALSQACVNGHTECVQLLIDHRADVNVKSRRGDSALYSAAHSHLSCVKLLVQNRADVNCQNGGWAPLMSSAFRGRLNIAQYLLEQKADVHYHVFKEDYRNTGREDALYYAMRLSAIEGLERTTIALEGTHGVAFAFLSCNTDAENVMINHDVTTTVRDAHIEAYSHVQAFIDEYHSILTRVLSDHVQVDTRVGRGDNGIYQEPLERTLEYLGLSMSKDQVVNTSIDGEAVKRALLPGHLLNANHWFNKHFSYKKALRSPTGSLPKRKRCTLS
jgi:hypothetical protein